MNSFFLAKDSPVSLDEMLKQLQSWPSAATLLLFKRHFGKDATIKFATDSREFVITTFADVKQHFYPDFPKRFLEWDKLIADAEVNRIWSDRTEDKRRKVAGRKVAASGSSGMSNVGKGR